MSKWTTHVRFGFFFAHAVFHRLVLPPSSKKPLRDAPGTRGLGPAPHVHQAGHLYPGGPQPKRSSPRQTAPVSGGQVESASSTLQSGQGPPKLDWPAATRPSSKDSAKESWAAKESRADHRATRAATTAGRRAGAASRAGPSKEADEACSLLAPAADLEREDDQPATVGRCEALFHGALPRTTLVLYMHVPSRKIVFVCDQSTNFATRC